MNGTKTTFDEDCNTQLSVRYFPARMKVSFVLWLALSPSGYTPVFDSVQNRGNRILSLMT